MMEYGKHKRVLIAVSLPLNFENLSWRRPSSSLMWIHGWSEDFSKKKALENVIERETNINGRFGWVEECDVLDSLGGKETDTTLYALIVASRAGYLEPVSWSCVAAYTSVKDAEAEANVEGEYLWKWTRLLHNHNKV